MKVSDFIVDFIKDQKTKEVFLITGAAIAFTVDAFANRRDIRYICMQHEQSAAMAAEAYSRLTEGIGVAMATSGPGATNLVTGICCAWFDSIPTLYITGQVNTKEQTEKRKVRQIGFQETKIVEIVKSITKFAEKLEKAEDIKYLLEKAVYIAKSDRPGPVLVDIPINLQYAQINPKSLESFIPPKPRKTLSTLNTQIKKVKALIAKSERPVILAGFGIHLGGAEKEFRKFINLLQIPTVTTWSGLDLLEYNHPLRVGQSGVYGDRAANFAVQNSDLLISLGARLDTRQTGGKVSSYARAAKKVVVDIDRAELYKGRGLTPKVGIESDAKTFLNAFAKDSKTTEVPDISRWVKIIKDWKNRYPTLKEEYFKQKKFVNPYVFTKHLSEALPSNAIIIPDEGGNLTWTVQGIRLKIGQRLFSAFGNSPMGYALPASIGASFAVGNKRPVICITGDGGLQINIQEFQTIIHHKLPIKIFILNNNCYGIIKQFQDTWMGSRYEASQIGYSTPNFIEVAQAYGFKTVQIKNHSELRKKITEVLSYKGPVFCDVLLNPDQKIEPKIEFGMPLEDMSPLLKREEFFKNMIIEPLPESKNIKV